MGYPALPRFPSKSGLVRTQATTSAESVQPTRNVSRNVVTFNWLDNDSKKSTNWTVWAPPGTSRIELPTVPDFILSPGQIRFAFLRVEYRETVATWREVLSGWEEMVFSGRDVVTGTERVEKVVPGLISVAGWRAGTTTVVRMADAGAPDSAGEAIPPLPPFCGETGTTDAGPPPGRPTCSDQERVKGAEYRIDSQTALRIPDGLCPGEPIRIAYVHGSQFDGDLAYRFDLKNSTALAWEQLARETSGVNMEVKFADVGSGEGANRIQRALDKFAALAGRGELRHVPLTLDGLSREGQSALVVGQTMRDRTALVIPYHIPIDGQFQGQTEVPVLAVMGGLDEDYRNLSLSRGLRILRNQGHRPIAAMVQPATKHNTVAANAFDHEFQVAFLRHFIDQRVPANVSSHCRPVLFNPEPAKAWLGIYDDLNRGGTPPGTFEGWYFSGPRIMAAANYAGSLQRTIWLPNEQIAKLWLQFHQTGSLAR
jgi:hypothetical protein